MLQTKFTELLGCTVPLQQAGMGKIASPALAAAVAEAGGLGMVSGIASAPPEYVAKILDGLRRSTSGAFGANFIVAGGRESGTLDADFLEGLGGRGLPGPGRRVLLVGPRPGTRGDRPRGRRPRLLANWLGSRGRGGRGGGLRPDRGPGDRGGRPCPGEDRAPGTPHRGPAVRQGPRRRHGRDRPGRAMAAALAAGASAVRVGTRFVAAEEAGTHPAYVDKLIAAEAKDTILTEAFSANWPNAPIASCGPAWKRS